MNDLPTRLRNLHEISPPATSVLLESAREIERLSCENEALLEVLRHVWDQRFKRSKGKSVLPEIVALRCENTILRDGLRDVMNMPGPLPCKAHQGIARDTLARVSEGRAPDD
jgi:hypothetical protein